MENYSLDIFKASNCLVFEMYSEYDFVGFTPFLLGSTDWYYVGILFQNSTIMLCLATDNWWVSVLETYVWPILSI